MSFDKKFLSHKIWDLYQTHGVPIEVSSDILEKNNLDYDYDYLEQLIEDHQKLSQTSSKGQFKSGLGQHNSKTKRLHTTTHILHKVLRDKFGENLRQMGSSITSEKARFDFSLENRIEENELLEIEKQVQTIIDKNLAMTMVETSSSEARNMNAIGLFGEKYGDLVTVYTLADKDGNVYSREFCGGPHIENSSEIGKFKILKQKSIGSGLKRLEFDVV